MKTKLLFISILVTFLGACGEEVSPKLDLNGHWTIKHGFFEDQCQIGATFTAENLYLTFFSLSEGACQAEVFGLQGDALRLEIKQREDFFDSNGELTAKLSLANALHQISGEVMLRQSPSGLLGVIIGAADPLGAVELLLDRDYPLSPVANDWYGQAQGQWSVLCSDIGLVDYEDGEICGFLSFESETNVRINAVPPGQSNVNYLDFNLAMRNINKVSESEYELNFIIYPLTEDIAPDESALAQFHIIGDAAHLTLAPPNDDLFDLDFIKTLP